MANLEPRLLTLTDRPGKLILALDKNDFLPAINNGMRYERITPFNIFQHTKINESLQKRMYVSWVKDDDIARSIADSYRLRARTPNTEASLHIELYRNDILEEIAVRGTDSQSFFAFIERYKIPIINSLKPRFESENHGEKPSTMPQNTNEEERTEQFDQYRTSYAALVRYEHRVNHEEVKKNFERFNSEIGKNDTDLASLIHSIHKIPLPITETSDDVLAYLQREKYADQLVHSVTRTHEYEKIISLDTPKN